HGGRAGRLEGDARLAADQVERPPMSEPALEAPEERRDARRTTAFATLGSESHDLRARSVTRSGSFFLARPRRLSLFQDLAASSSSSVIPTIWRNLSLP